MGKLILITGSDEFAIKDMARDVIVSFCGENFEDDAGLEIIKGDDETKKPAELLSDLLAALNTPPFLSPQKVVWLKHFPHFDKVLSGTKTKEAEIEPISEYIKSGIPDDVTLLIDGPNMDKRKAFYKLCKKEGEIHILEKTDLSDKNFTASQFQKIRNFCRDNSKNIDDDAVQYLAETLGSDSARLRNELEKLICYVGDKNFISFDDCKDICSRTPEALSWAFADALIEKKPKKAIDTINTLMEQMRAGKSGYNSELAILSFAVKRFQEIIKAKAAAEELNFTRRSGQNFFYSLPAGAKEQFPDNFLLSLHPFRAFKLCESAGNFSDREMSDAVNELLEANKKLVSGGSDSRIALEQLALKISRPGR
jgi:DNA polymerase-3 subunit delta